MSRKMTLPELEKLMARTRERAEAAYREKRPIEACSLLADLAKLELEYGVRLNDSSAFSLVHAERSFVEAVDIAKRLAPDHKDAVAQKGLPHAQTPMDALIERLEVEQQPAAAEALRLSNYAGAVRILLDALIVANGKTDPAPPE